MSLHAVGAADDQHGAVQHLQSAFHLAGEIHMPRCVQQGELRPLQGDEGLFGKDGDAPLPFQGVGIQKGVLVVHPPQGFQAPRPVQQSLREGGLARVHMGQQTHANPLYRLARVPHAVTSLRCVLQGL